MKTCCCEGLKQVLYSANAGAATCPKDPWLLPPAAAQAVGQLDSSKDQSSQVHEV